MENIAVTGNTGDCTNLEEDGVNEERTIGDNGNIVDVVIHRTERIVYRKSPARSRRD